MKCAGSGRVMDVDTSPYSCACNTGKERYSPAVTCHELPDGSGRFYLFRCRLLSSVSLAVACNDLAAFDAGLSPALAQTAGHLTSGSASCTPHGNPIPPASATIPTTPPDPHHPHASAGCQCHHPRRLARG